MRRTNPNTTVETANACTGDLPRQRPGAALRRQVFLGFLTLLTGAALVAVVYFLRLDTFAGRTKALVDLVMVAVAVGFLVSLYMVVDATLKKPEG